MSHATWRSSRRSATRRCCTRSPRTTWPTTARRWARSSSCRTAPASRCRRAPGGWRYVRRGRERVLPRPSRVEPGRARRDTPAGRLPEPARLSRVLPRLGRRRARSGGRPRLWDEPHLRLATCRLQRLRRRRDVAHRLPRRAGRERRGSRRPYTVACCRCPATWDAVAALPGLEVLATDLYGSRSAVRGAFSVREYAERLATTARAHGVGAQLWVPSFRLTLDDILDLTNAVAIARAAGIDDLWTVGVRSVRLHEPPGDAGLGGCLEGGHGGAHPGGVARSTRRCP